MTQGSLACCAEPTPDAARGAARFQTALSLSTELGAPRAAADARAALGHIAGGPAGLAQYDEALRIRRQVARLCIVCAPLCAPHYMPECRVWIEGMGVKDGPDRNFVLVQVSDRLGEVDCLLWMAQVCRLCL